jgi:hypothetical protein
MIGADSLASLTLDHVRKVKSDEDFILEYHDSFSSAHPDDPSNPFRSIA